MNPDPNRKLADQYLEQVEAALAATDHPRKAEVLADVRAHLDEKIAAAGSGADVTKILEDMGPPEEYAEGLEDKEAPRPRSKTLLIFTICAAAAVMLALVAGLNWRSIQYAIGKKYRPASAFFDEKRFAQLKPGMTADEIRDQIGFPYVRQIWSDNLNELKWAYTVPPSPEVSYYDHYTVCTDVQTWKLVRTEKDRRGFEKGVAGEIADGPNEKHVGDLKLRTLHNDIQFIHPNDPSLYVIQIIDAADVSNPIEFADKTARKRAWISERWKDLTKNQKDQIKLIQVFQFLTMDEKILAELKKNKIDTSAMYFFGDPLWKPDEALIYKAGWLYEYPPILGDALPAIVQSYRDDQLWLIKRLLTGGPSARP